LRTQKLSNKWTDGHIDENMEWGNAVAVVVVVVVVVDVVDVVVVVVVVVPVCKNLLSSNGSIPTITTSRSGGAELHVAVVVVAVVIVFLSLVVDVTCPVRN